MEMNKKKAMGNKKMYAVTKAMKGITVGPERHVLGGCLFLPETSNNTILNTALVITTSDFEETIISPILIP